MRPPDLRSIVSDHGGLRLWLIDGLALIAMFATIYAIWLVLAAISAPVPQ